MDQIRAAFKCGELLIAERKQLASGKWGKWCSDNLKGISQKTLDRYASLATGTVLSKLIRQYRTLYDAYLGEGIMPKQRKRVTQPTEGKNTRKVLKLVRDFDKARREGLNYGDDRVKSAEAIELPLGNGAFMTCANLIDVLGNTLKVNTFFDHQYEWLAKQIACKILPWYETYKESNVCVDVGTGNDQTALAE